MATYPVQTQNTRHGDILIFELTPEYNRVSAKVKNGGAAAVDILDPMGFPVKSDGAGGYAIAYAGDEASVIGLIIFNKELAIVNAQYSLFAVPIIVRGPAVFDASNLPLLDAAAAPGTFNQATLQSTLKALNIIPLVEPAIVATQTS